jgi:hypothetical protein
MKINIFKNTNITKDDVNIIDYLINNIKWETVETKFEIKTYQHVNVNIAYADLNIHLDMISPIGLNLSDYNLLIPELDVYNKNQNDYLSKINLVLYKTHQDQDKFKEIFNKPVSAKYLGMITPERLNKSSDFIPKDSIVISTLLHDENKYDVVNFAKAWSYSTKLKIYTYLKSDDCLLDIIGLKNVEILFDLEKMYSDNSCYIQIGTTIPYIILENMCYGNIIFYRDDIEHEYLSTCHGFVEYNLENINKKLDNLSIRNNSNIVRNTFINFTNEYVKNFKRIFNLVFANVEPFEPIINELPDNLPLISLISNKTNNLLQKWYDDLDYPKDKLEWLVGENTHLLINDCKGDYVMMFNMNFYYNPQCIKNRLIMIRDKECVYSAIKPNYNYIRKISSIIVEPATKNYRERIVPGSLFFKKQFWNSAWEFKDMIEINWLGVFIGIDTNINIDSEPNGCHFNFDGGMDLDTIEFLNNSKF